MKCQTMFSGEKKKKNIKLSSVESAQIVLNISLKLVLVLLFENGNVNSRQGV